MKLIVKNANFRNLITGESISLTGDILNNLALLWIIGKISDNSLVIGSIYGIAKIVYLVMLPFMGSIVDRFNNKKLLIFMDTVLGMVSNIFL